MNAVKATTTVFLLLFLSALTVASPNNNADGNGAKPEKKEKVSSTLGLHLLNFLLVRPVKQDSTVLLRQEQGPKAEAPEAI